MFDKTSKVLYILNCFKGQNNKLAACVFGGIVSTTDSLLLSRFV